MLLFNWIGYRLVSRFMEVKANQSLEARLDKNDYDESQLIEMRVSLNLPYQNDWTEFERYDGEIVIAGTHYKYVKRKIEKGQLVVMCIPNQDKTKIENSRDDYFKMVNDLQQNGQGKKSEKANSVAFKGLFNEYQSENNNWSVNAPILSLPLFKSFETALISSLYTRIPGQPPELC
ncbi:MAG TPA: hypothetical protein VK625_21705 [Flavitalea sp.]|nr:hypothetical protein [Flavitalea sp.]